MRRALICGLGPSAWVCRHELERARQRPRDWLLVGVNDFDAIATPDVLVIADHAGEFTPRRLRTILASEASEILLWQGWGSEQLLRDPRTARFELDPPVQMSVTAAAKLMLSRGVRELGVLGVDLIGHQLEGAYADVVDELRQLAAHAAGMGGCVTLVDPPSGRLSRVEHAQIRRAPLDSWCSLLAG